MKLKIFTIVEKKWARGGKNGASRLENEDGFRCCLGFLCLAAGAKSVEGFAMPGGLSKKNPKIRRELPTLVLENGETSKSAWEIARINDNRSISDSKRKLQLAPLFAKIGWQPIYN